MALVSPISDKTRIFRGAVVESLEVMWDKTVEAGRRHATLTVVTAYTEEVVAATPSSLTAYGGTFSYMRTMTATKSIGGDVVVLGKVGYKITNPVRFIGQQGANGEPEMIARAIPSVDVKIMGSVKYDTNTETWWEDHRAGTSFAVEISDNATWASATSGFKAGACKMTSEPAPADTEDGAFIDFELTATDDLSNDLIQIVPG